MKMRAVLLDSSFSGHDCNLLSHPTGRDRLEKTLERKAATEEKPTCPRCRRRN